MYNLIMFCRDQLLTREKFELSAMQPISLHLQFLRVPSQENACQEWLHCQYYTFWQNSLQCHQDGTARQHP